MDANGLPIDPVVVYNGKLSAKGLFDFIRANKNKTIIFDDITSFDKDQMGIIKDICGESASCSWATTYNTEHFKFEGSVIINSNSETENRDIQAIKSRAFVCKFVVNPLNVQRKNEMFWDAQMGKIEPDTKVWREIRTRFLEMPILELTQKEMEGIKAFVESVKIYHNSDISMRDNVNTLKFFIWWKSFWGGLSKEVFEYGIQIMKEFYAGGQAKEKSLTLETAEEYISIHNTGEIRKKELGYALISKYNIKLRTAQQWIESAIYKKELEEGSKRTMVQIAKPANYVAPVIVKTF